MHSVLCVSTQQVPLGILHQEVWVRDLTQLGKKLYSPQATHPRQSPICGQLNLELQRQPQRQPRLATLTLRFATTLASTSPTASTAS